jgi:hypothetical protein
VAQGNVRKYLVYAIGEVLLVVIGILIALQVNNWNNESARKDSEIDILQEINRNLSINVSELSAEISKQEGMISTINLIMEQIKNDIPPHDSMGLRYASVAWGENFKIANSAFENLKTSGFNLVSSDTLRRNIIQLFNVSYDGMAVMFQEVQVAEYANISPLYIRHIEYDEDGNAIVNDFEDLKNDREFTNMLSSRRVWKKDLINMFELLIKETQQLSKMIDQELLKRHQN